MHALRLISGFVSLSIAAGLIAPQAAHAQSVGTLTSEKATISRSGSRLQVGTGILLGDRLASNATGSGMIVFQDQSSARMGPNAQLTIDEFVYNPSRRNGTIRLRQNGGVARIYGGQISKRGRSEVRTPHIVLAVRGGIVDSAVTTIQSIMTLRGGLMVCSLGNQKVTVTNPGFSCISDGQTLKVARIVGGIRQLVTPTNPGQGGASGNGRYNGANCASAAGVGAAGCQSRDGGLPGPGKNGGNNQQGGSAPGGGQMDDYSPPACRDPAYCK